VNLPAAAAAEGVVELPELQQPQDVPANDLHRAPTAADELSPRARLEPILPAPESPAPESPADEDEWPAAPAPGDPPPLEDSERTVPTPPQEQEQPSDEDAENNEAHWPQPPMPSAPRHTVEAAPPPPPSGNERVSKSNNEKVRDSRSAVGATNDAHRFPRKTLASRLPKAGLGSGMVKLGRMFEEGIGVQKSAREAFKCYLKAARSNDPNGQYNVGRYCAEGQVVRQDFSAAKRWFDLAAQQGHALAQTCLGIMYQHGLGVSPDLSEAAGWYEKAAAQGEETATASLAVMETTDRQSRPGRAVKTSLEIPLSDHAPTASSPRPQSASQRERTAKAED
jgi:hypothetical protein